MLKLVRQRLIHHLWKNYHHSTLQMQIIENRLKQKGMPNLIQDHLAIIDLPGPHTGISQLKQIFSAIGYVERGKDYLPDKQNDFLWMAEADSLNSVAKDALPQVVIADFRLEELPDNVRNILKKYAQQAVVSPYPEVEQLVAHIEKGDTTSVDTLVNLLSHYFSRRDWSLPTLQEFRAVQQFNELIAWVLVFGRRPNHFTISVHHLSHFANMTEFQQFLEMEVQLELNQEGGKIKGGPAVGMAQGATKGLLETIALSDGYIALSTGFVEFIWRYPLIAEQHPVYWSDYFRGFRPQYANQIIESLYVDKNVKVGEKCL